MEIKFAARVADFLFSFDIVSEDNPDILALNKNAKKFAPRFELMIESVIFDARDESQAKYVTEGCLTVIQYGMLHQVNDIA